METTRVFSELAKALTTPGIRVIGLKGGTRSSKNWSTLQMLDYVGRNSTTPRLISVVSETMPHLKRGAIRDFKKILTTDSIYNPDAWHDTDKTYTYKNSVLEFFSADQPAKVHGPARDWLYMNEAINMQYEVYRQLAIRTTDKIILDWNPAYEYWFDKKLASRDDVITIHSTYRDNDMLTPSQIAEIESSRETDPDWWNVYGLGLTGNVQGMVWRNWDIVDQMPRNFKYQWIGIDWGWTNPTAVMHIGLGEMGEVWIDQLLYARNMDNPQIIKCIKDAGLDHLEILADPAEPKSGNELRNAGLNVARDVNKSVDLGISVVNRYKKHYTARSLEAIDENRKYRYKQDKSGEYINEVIKKFDHSKDAERYVFLNRLSDIHSGFDVTVSNI